MIEYLSKKGYTKTEATLRAESANQDADGKPIFPRNEDFGGSKYRLGYGYTTLSEQMAMTLTFNV